MNNIAKNILNLKGNLMMVKISSMEMTSKIDRNFELIIITQNRRSQGHPKQTNSLEQGLSKFASIPPEGIEIRFRGC